MRVIRFAGERPKLYLAGRMPVVAPQRVGLLAPLPHSGMGVTQFYSMHFLGAAIPLTAGLLLYGWRAAVVVALVVGSAAVAVAVWRRIGPRGRQLHYAHALWLALLLALMLPAQLVSSGEVGGDLPWPILPFAGWLLVVLLWVLGGLGSARIHPVLVTYLLLVVCFGEALVPRWILQRDHVFVGDLMPRDVAAARMQTREPWIARRHNRSPAMNREPASERLIQYTSGHEVPARRYLLLSGLLRDQMPPLEDLIVAGEPGPIGASSAVAIIIGGLFLLYRGLIDFRIPLLICGVAYVALLVLPVPVRIESQPVWRWMAFHRSQVGWAVGVTFVNYEVMASPLIFMAFFLATAPAVRPMARRARVLYAALAGLLAAVSQLYMSVSWGPYLALLAASLLTPLMDRWFRPRALV